MIRWLRELSGFRILFVGLVRAFLAGLCPVLEYLRLRRLENFLETFLIVRQSKD